MTVLPAKSLSLAEVEATFGLRQVEDPHFFPEWQSVMPNLAVADRQWLDQVKADFLALAKHPLHEEIVKLVVLAPLLSLAGLCRPPFLPRAEEPIEVTIPDGDDLARGRIDVLILHQTLWVTVVESKRQGLDVRVALPQALAYLFAQPQDSRPAFGLVTNGSHFIFIKLVRGEDPRYALSDEFTLRKQGNDLYAVLSILQRLGQCASQPVAA
ncbi:MAG: restriction endonuclease subunit R [Spirulina sp.]